MISSMLGVWVCVWPETVEAHTHANIIFQCPPCIAVGADNPAMEINVELNRRFLQ